MSAEQGAPADALPRAAELGRSHHENITKALDVRIYGQT